jgi:nucleotide-binding universal stress UspA family protein
MALISRILMPVVFSARCRAATRYAESLALHFRCHLTFLHVVEPFLGTYVSTEAMVYSSVADQDDTRLADAEARLRELGPLAAPSEDGVARVVVRGDPAQEIIKYAHDSTFDLIVMPSHGHGPFRRLLLGSVTAKVLHDAGCPVWTGPHLEDAPMPQSIRFRRILCALDQSDEAPDVLAWAGRFAQEFRARLAIVHVLPPAPAHLEGVYFDPGWSAETVRLARERIAALQEQASTQAEVEVEAGDVPDVVSSAAARLGADLLVIGRGRRPGVLGRLRAMAYAILRESPCPVVAV